MQRCAAARAANNPVKGKPAAQSTWPAGPALSTVPRSSSRVAGAPTARLQDPPAPLRPRRGTASPGGPHQAGVRRRASPRSSQATQQVCACRSLEPGGPRIHVGPARFHSARSGEPAPSSTATRGPTAARHLN
ncbi:hypothetical protein NDU88_002195 [Pleurodeles waltl]|uniref:Uncharacterized protein n=1 Tax=Pleurodeles waltl TaxID=8319 RepID=A0AAV7UV04_PLEWA|nr:hypothetical protein NDU88_002195 [Pleurodeles waltl]